MLDQLMSAVSLEYYVLFIINYFNSALQLLNRRL